MRLILARIIYNFDIRMNPGSPDWFDNQKEYVLWHKPALDVFLTPAKLSA